jgi:RNA polymerase sigma-70 factor (ECF subfamily)
MAEEPTTTVIQRYLDALPGVGDAAPAVRALLERAVGRLRLLCASLLYRSYPRLMRPPVKLETDELLGGVVAALLTALRATRPPTVRHFFGLACQHMRSWATIPARSRAREQIREVSLVFPRRS